MTTRRSARMRTMFAAIATLTTSAVAGVARADDDMSELEGLLNESVVSTASKSAEVGTTAPATTTTITAEDLKRYGIHTLAEAINYLSLGAITSDSQHMIDVGVRGVMIPNDNGDHMLLLINGHAVNEPLFGAARFGRGAGIPIEMVDHIEVILGPGSVLYGSNAMLGVINVITKRAKDWTGVHVVSELEPGRSWRVGAGAATPFTMPVLGSAGEITLGVEYFDHDGPALRYELENAGIDKVTARPYRFRRGGPENGYWGGVARNAYYTQVPAGFMRLVIGDFELNVQAKSFKSASPYRSLYTKNFMDFDDPDSYEHERHLWFDLTHRATLASIVRLITRAYVDGWDWYSDVNSSEASACIVAGNSLLPTCTVGARGRTRWGGLEIRAELDWFENARFVTTLGVDGRLRQAGFKADFLDFKTHQPLQSSTGVIDREDRLLGAYAQQTLLPVRWLSINGGARIDTESRFSLVVSPRVAAAANVWTGGTLKGIYAEAFRSPSFIETDLAEAIQLRSEGLVPERVRSVEGSFEQKRGAHRVLFGVFRSWWKNMVANHVLTPLEHEEAVRRREIELNQFGVAQFRNVAGIDNYGFNGSIEGTVGGLQQFRYGINLTGAVARRDEPGVASAPLAVAPKFFGNARLAYDLPGDWPTLAVAAHHLGKRPVDRAYDGNWSGGTYASQQLELRGTISGPVPMLKGLSYRASATYAFTSRGPYVVGPIQSSDLNNPTPQLLPLDQFRAALSLRYDLTP